MPRAKLLLADNNPNVLRLWSELLRRRDFAVIEASSVAMAKEAMRQGAIDVAILDLRLESDGEEEDDSGLQLAHDLVQAHSGAVPIIILSGMPESTLAWMLKTRQGENRRQPFVSMVSKISGPKVLLQEIDKALLGRRDFGG